MKVFSFSSLVNGCFLFMGGGGAFLTALRWEVVRRGTAGGVSAFIKGSKSRKDSSVRLALTTGTEPLLAVKLDEAESMDSDEHIELGVFFVFDFAEGKTVFRSEVDDDLGKTGGL